MYCTGGIRERASAYLRSKISNIYQLKGGIHRYVEALGDDGFFKGKDFVFDRRCLALGLEVWAGWDLRACKCPDWTITPRTLRAQRVVYGS